MMTTQRRHLIAGFALCSLLAAAPLSSLAQQAEADIPPQIMTRLSGLSAAQLDFLRGFQPLRVIPTREKLNQELDRRTPEQIEQFVSDMMMAVEAMAFRPGVDMAEIPLNPEASRFNSFKVVTPEILNEYLREPGPFSVHRYIHQWGGIPTFAGALVAADQADLIAGDVEVAIVGIPQSMSSGSRDARNAPEAVRSMHVLGTHDVYSMVDPLAVLNVVDYGDISVDRMSVHRGVQHVYERIMEISETGAVPFVVGGDHSLMYPTVKAVHDIDAGDPLTVVHFGANYNAEPTRAHLLSDRDAVYRLISEAVVDGSNVIQVGLRGSQATPQSFQWLREQGVKYHTMAEVERHGWDVVAERVIDEARSATDRVYISLDVSVLDPAQLTAAGRAAPGGLTVRELAPLLRRLCAETQIAGFEIMDLAPMLDLSYVSAMNANYMMNACLSGVAMRKMGLDDENYLDPLTVDHGQN
ncbi:agmatinase family protein [Pseudohongiella sp.]|uniref:Arginase n=1 Tax=marine sediment metagenome TaxID=412755 RepID=A0A0F9WJG5_9ZZZZ|nr:agmatinase family protein [Pseudohongiella sp.]HDZ08226.1 arginase [Pseudohongiella sp.]HEA63194.1 arginase [Pseudohongiella sp.]